MCGGPVIIHVDCEGTLGCARLLGSTDWSQEPRAHWWSEVNDRLHLAIFELVDSNLPYEAVRGGRITHRGWNGNRQADLYAKKGADPFRAADDDLLLAQGFHALANGSPDMRLSNKPLSATPTFTTILGMNG